MFLKFQLSDHKSPLFLATFVSTMVLATWNHFTKGGKQNSSTFHSYCNGCVKHHYEILKINFAGNLFAITLLEIVVNQAGCEYSAQSTFLTPQ